MPLRRPNNKSLKTKNNYVFSNNAERVKWNKLAKQFGFKKIPTENKAFNRAWNQIIKEMKKKKHLDFVDLDRILGKHGFSFSENQVDNLMTIIKQTGILDIKKTKNKNFDAHNFTEYVLK